MQMKMQKKKHTKHKEKKQQPNIEWVRKKNPQKK
jgi:hypothetical protein